MFNNVGGKIKGVVKGFFAINVIFTVILGIVVWYNVADWNNGFVGFLAGGFTFAIGFFFAWLSSLAAYAFGQLVENSDRIREHLENGADNTSKDSSDSYNNSNTGYNNGSASYTSSGYNANVYVNENGNSVTCPKCNESQPVGRGYCSICGTSLKIANPTESEVQAFNLHEAAENTTEADDGLVCCSKCGELQKKGVNYCQICGGKVY